MREDQIVLQMAEEVLSRQAQTRAKRTGEPFEEALKAVLETEAGQQLGELRDRSHRHDGAREWQESLPRERAEERWRHFGMPVPAEIPDARPLGGGAPLLVAGGLPRLGLDDKEVPRVVGEGSRSPEGLTDVGPGCG